MTRPLRLDVFGATDRGKARLNNEDNFVVATIRRTIAVDHGSVAFGDLTDRFQSRAAHLLAVADGVGGRPGGEIASRRAVEDLVAYVASAAACFDKNDAGDENAFLERLESTIRATHEGLSQGDTDAPPATTLTMALLIGARVYLVHVGDTRAYYLRGGRLHQLTRDQTVGEYMMSIGAWTDTQASKAPVGSALTSAIGGSELSPTIGVVDVAAGEVMMLCSDGLTKHVSDDRIASTLERATGAQAACEALVRMALEGGGSDNISVIVARLMDP